ncbi:hypothetical protein NLJ89_g11765 [Agrocybe chaxingu]|uniref:Uncharacterized protein n=1 Tax=Agrocybe chaxingu TaxID=84603 RepID=A0A9W8JPE8_9AGAR|nr:hypothetical protein NLJ89_g11765 [Agrocybe chaxingu]
MYASIYLRTLRPPVSDFDFCGAPLFNFNFNSTNQFNLNIGASPLAAPDSTHQPSSQAPAPSPSSRRLEHVRQHPSTRILEHCLDPASSKANCSTDAEGAEAGLRRSNHLQHPPQRCQEQEDDANDIGSKDASNSSSAGESDSDDCPIEGPDEDEGEGFPVPSQIMLLLVKLNLYIVPLRHFSDLPSLIVCGHPDCRKGISLKAAAYVVGTRKDQYHSHGISLPLQGVKRVKEWIVSQHSCLVDQKNAPVHLLPNTQAFPHLDLYQDGLQCLFHKTCTYVAENMGSLDKHVRVDHKDKSMYHSLSYKSGILYQCFFRGRARPGECYFFKVLKPRSNPAASDQQDLFSLYLSTYPEHGEDAAHDYILLRSDRREMPLFLQIAGFPNHIFKHIKKGADNDSEDEPEPERDDICAIKNSDKELEKAEIEELMGQILDEELLAKIQEASDDKKEEEEEEEEDGPPQWIRPKEQERWQQ